MRIPLPTLVAIIGLLGIIAGSVIQAVVARANRRHERGLALEIKRTEERISAYTALVKYVMQAERAAGRTIGSFDRVNLHADSLSAVGDNAEFDCKRWMGDEVIARLTTFSSIYLTLFFACWKYDFARADRARWYKQVISSLSLRKGEYISSEDEVDLDRADRIANQRAAEFAERLVKQVQAELAGESSFYRTGQKISRYFRDKRKARKMGSDNDFIEDALNRVDAKISAALNSLEATATASPAGPSIAQAEQQPQERQRDSECGETPSHPPPTAAGT